LDWAIISLKKAAREFISMFMHTHRERGWRERERERKRERSQLTVIDPSDIAL